MALSSVTLADLPVEVVEHIFSFALDDEELITFFHTSQCTRSLAYARLRQILILENVVDARTAALPDASFPWTVILRVLPILRIIQALHELIEIGQHHKSHAVISSYRGPYQGAGNAYFRDFVTKDMTSLFPKFCARAEKSLVFEPSIDPRDHSSISSGMVTRALRNFVFSELRAGRCAPLFALARPAQLDQFLCDLSSVSYREVNGAMETFFSSCPCPLARTTFPLVPLSPAEQQVVSQLKGRDFFDASTDSNELEGVLQSLRCAEEAAAAAGWRLYRPEQLTLLAQHKCILGRSKSDRSCVIQ